ncbi:hypothetical protein J2Z40_002942 [Cytobacillus eiseniae]|uniref:Uncharacterized protein n=1 Tax=Cytobacillus eiseniae TaxID=762947 RepID=A0ABS4RHJ3_9BACI|nr:hypothetical protein [Cytobacillus eiseniae]MBP2242368.1 hypothetical protein [Cytobacillus eiseniae]
MAKKGMLIFILLSLLPICFGVYYMLFNEVQKNETNSIEEESKEPSDKEEHKNRVEEENKQDMVEASNDHLKTDNGEESIDSFLPMDDIDDEAIRKEEELNGMDTEVHLAEEPYDLPEGANIIEHGSNRHLEILAEQFVMMHFDLTDKLLSYHGEFISRDNQYAKVTVLKTDFRSLEKEKFNVILSLQGQIQAISLQVIDNY